MKPFSQRFEVLTQLGDVINPKLARKRAQTCTSCASGDRKMKMKSFQKPWGKVFVNEIIFWKSLNFSPYWDVIILKLGQIESPFAHDMQIVGVFYSFVV